VRKGGREVGREAMIACVSVWGKKQKESLKTIPEVSNKQEQEH
jgi:hypothetical protein